MQKEICWCEMVVGMNRQNKHCLHLRKYIKRRFTCLMTEEGKIIHNKTKALYQLLQSPKKRCTKSASWDISWGFMRYFLRFHPTLSDAADTSRPLWRRWVGRGALQLAMWDFSLGILGCALRHLWQRNSIFSKLSSSITVATPCFSISLIASAESRKNKVLKEFQCFLFFKCAESKSWLMTWRCSCCIDGTLMTITSDQNQIK